MLTVRQLSISKDDVCRISFAEEATNWYIVVGGSLGGVVFMIILVSAIYFIWKKFKEGKLESRARYLLKVY